MVLMENDDFLGCQFWKLIFKLFLALDFHLHYASVFYVCSHIFNTVGYVGDSDKFAVSWMFR